MIRRTTIAELDKLEKEAHRMRPKYKTTGNLLTMPIRPKTGRRARRLGTLLMFPERMNG